jgi:hypothetical protein
MHPRTLQRSVASLIAPALAFALAACGGGAETGPAPKTAVETPLGAMKESKVYDARGQAKACAAPETSCPPIAPDRELSDKCSLAGFRMVQCGCESLCTGDVSGAKQAYDAEGHAKACAPATADCTPPAASAAFQDACTDKGYRLEQCGCEWLCSGKTAQ